MEGSFSGVACICKKRYCYAGPVSRLKMHTVREEDCSRKESKEGRLWSACTYTRIWSEAYHESYNKRLIAEFFSYALVPLLVDRLCCLAVRVPGYRSRSPGFDFRG
jgi:hypothetical protein